MSNYEYIYKIVKDMDGVDCYIKTGEIVRCKDCKHKKEYRGGDICYRLKGTVWIVDDDFCSYAERRSDETD